MNLIIKNIGLSYVGQMDELKKGRFSKHLVYFQLMKEGNTEIQSTVRYIKIEKNGQKPTILEIQYTLWHTIFSEIGGYEYVVLPIRKIAGWLYSINSNKVNPEVKPKLEMYQEECDDVLNDHFFGAVAKRKKALMRKSEIRTELGEIELELTELPLYQRYINLKAEEMRLGKDLKDLDREVIEKQLTLFN